MTKIIVANWKMNGSKAFITEFFKNFISAPQNFIIFCPPALYLKDVLNHTSRVGGQDCSSHLSGAYTGDISSVMLNDIGCQYVLLGHSERRSYHKETSETVRQKAGHVLKADLIPIICIGESKEVRDAGRARDFVLEQLSHSLPAVSDKTYYIAYEPVWAIGTGLTATENDIIQMHEAIRQALPQQHIPLLYGGSVNKENAHTILALPNVDGVLVGGASLKYEDFNHIVAFSELPMV
ncbi:MAG: triose-phosphate isomerase [Candidatus Paracaedibacteraceae bacterium]|nr:triose-phosphate isomerase [Candidatus Paracaedibacteraceae bacterium]